MFFRIICVLKILHWRILQKPLIVFGISTFEFLIFFGFFGLNVVQRLLLAITRDAEASQQPRLFETVALLNLVQVFAHAQNAGHVVIRLIRVNHSQIQTQHGVCTGNVHSFFAHLNHIITVTRHRFINECYLHRLNRNLVMLWHNFADSRVLGYDHAFKIVVFQTFFDLASTILRIHGQHVKVWDLRKQRFI